MNFKMSLLMRVYDKAIKMFSKVHCDKDKTIFRINQLYNDACLTLFKMKCIIKDYA